MLRMTILTGKCNFSLGIGAIEEFFKVMGTNDIDSTGTVDDAFILKLESMDTHEFGFTEEYKNEFLGKMKSEIGGHYLITDDWHLCDQKLEILTMFVRKMNEGLSFEDAKKAVKEYHEKQL